jgi:hypothetical protein
MSSLTSFCTREDLKLFRGDKHCDTIPIVKSAEIRHSLLVTAALYGRVVKKFEMDTEEWYITNNPDG